jgi:hypothetical protein
MAGFQVSINGRFWVSTEGPFVEVLGPEIGFASALYDSGDWVLSSGSGTLVWTAILWSMSVYLPLGLIAGAAYRVAHTRSWDFKFISLLAVALPPVALETSFALQLGIGIRTDMVMLGTTLAGVGFLAGAWCPVNRLERLIARPSFLHAGEMADC